MEPYKRDRNFAMFIAGFLIVTVCMLALFGCTYGTYNSTGSYPNQDNHKTDNCASTKD